MGNAAIEFPLVGPGGEKVDLWRTLNAHGVSDLPPMQIDQEARTLSVALALPGFGPRMVMVAAGPPGFGAITIRGGKPARKETDAILAGVRHILRLEEDLSPFYALASSDPDLSWTSRGAGRMTRCATVFEDVVKTILTTNCAWSATERMTATLVESLGEPAVGAPETGPWGRAFPTPAAMAAKDEAYYRETVRCGYRARYLCQLSRSIAAGELDIESFGQATADVISDDDLAKELLTLPGVGPYAASHIMMMLGRSSRLILDSWTRPTYAKLVERESVPDKEIVERFARYGSYAGLAFWLFVTRAWIDDHSS